MNDTFSVDIAAETRTLAVRLAMEKAKAAGFDPYFYQADATRRVADPTDDDYNLMVWHVAMLGEYLTESEKRALDGDR